MSAEFFLQAEAAAGGARRVPVPPAGLTIGRAEETSQLVLSQPEVSRCHARIEVTAAGLCLSDLSVNGTYLNGQRVAAETKLQAGDELRFGSPAGPAFTVCAAAAPARGHEPLAAAGTIRIEPNTLSGALSGAHSGAAAGPKPAPECSLDLVVDQAPADTIALTGMLILGRQSGPARLAIPHASVSAAHAEISVTPAGARLRDLGSRNGTFVNQELISDVTLADGDLIQLGSCDSHLLLFREARRRPLHLDAMDVSAAQVRLGRGEDNDVRLDHPTISLHHAEIRNRGGAQIVDLGSTNGTFVNGEAAARPLRLAAGDRVHLGALEFIFDGTHLEGAGAGGTRLSAAGLRVEVRDHSHHAAKVLIDDISLVIEPRQFVGLLGGSGAGKSTLMDALNGSRPAQSGNVWLNQVSLYQQYHALRSGIGYVPQDDILHTELTVRECLYFSARLRLPDDYGEAALNRKVAEVIETLELGAHAAQPVRSLSGGQRKRVSVGIELLSDPGILFLDEPTAGQDPKNEQQMMQLFRRIANRGASVIINTHLLGSFGLLDRVAVLVGGRMAYYGPAPEMLGYFQCEQPQEVYYRLKDQATPEQWAQKYQRSPQFRNCVQSALPGGARPATRPRLAAPEPQPAAAPAVAPKPKHAVPRQAATLLARQWRRKLKDKANLAVLLLPPSVIAALIGMMDWPRRGLDGRLLFNPNTPLSLFMLVLIALWFGCSATVRELVDEAPVYRRERQRDLNLSSYLASKLAYLGMLAGVQSGLAIAVMLELHVVAGHSWSAWGWMWLLTVQGGIIGLLISALSSSAEMALYTFPLVMIAELLFAGILVPTAPLTPFYMQPSVTSSGQLKALLLYDHPGWIPLAPSMSPMLRRTMAAVMISRWGMEGLANEYSQDLGDLPACAEAQQSGTQGDNCAYSLALTDMVAFTFRPHASADARAYVRQLAAAVRQGTGDAPSGLPPTHSGAEYLIVQALFLAAMIAALTGAMRWKERKLRGPRLV